MTSEIGSILNDSKRNHMTMIHWSFIIDDEPITSNKSWVNKPPKLEPGQISSFIILHSLDSSSSTRKWWHCEQKVISYPNKFTFLILVNLILVWNRFIYWLIKSRIKCKRKTISNWLNEWKRWNNIALTKTDKEKKTEKKLLHQIQIVINALSMNASPRRYVSNIHTFYWNS